MIFATDQLVFNIPLLLVGLFLLLKGSDWFVDASSFIARRFQVSEIVIGLTLVSIGTSLPELATNVYASFTREGSIALGNVVGSNITNIALVLGVGTILKGNLPIPEDLLKRDAVIMILSYVGFIALCWVGFIGEPGELSRGDGIILLVCFTAYLLFLFKNKNTIEEHVEEENAEDQKVNSMGKAVLFFILGLVMIFSGAKMAVDTVVQTAKSFNISKELISATVIAFGTSVPELAVTITGIAKKKNALALGNIIGSCIFNLVLVMGAAAVIVPVSVSAEMLNILLPWMLVSGVILVIFMKTGLKLARIEGIILLLIYLMFIFYNIMQIF